MRGIDNMVNELRLRVVYDLRDQEILKALPKDGIYAEFDVKDFEKVLLEEFDKVKNVKRALERTCDRLKKTILRM